MYFPKTDRTRDIGGGRQNDLSEHAFGKPHNIRGAGHELLRQAAIKRGQVVPFNRRSSHVLKAGVR